MKNSLIAAALAAAALAPLAATAQEKPAAAASSPAPTVGATVYGPDGETVGRVDAVQNGVVTVNTGTAQAGLPLSAFAMREKGLTIGMRKAQLDAAVNDAKAQAATARDAALVAGAAVNSSDGVALGTVTTIQGDDVTVQLSSGSAVVLKRENLGLVANTLTLGMTAAAFAEQANAGTAAAAAAPVPSSTPAADTPGS